MKVDLHHPQDAVHRQAARRHGARLLALGLGVGALGAGGSWASHAIAKPGAQYSVAAGAIGTGLVLMATGLVHLLTGSSLDVLYRRRSGTALSLLILGIGAGTVL